MNKPRLVWEKCCCLVSLIIGCFPAVISLFSGPPLSKKGSSINGVGQNRCEISWEQRRPWPGGQAGPPAVGSSVCDGALRYSADATHGGLTCSRAGAFC